MSHILSQVLGFRVVCEFGFWELHANVPCFNYFCWFKFVAIKRAESHSVLGQLVPVT
jgi:hypothetical protein